MSSVVTGVVNVVSTLVAIFLVDRCAGETGGQAAGVYGQTWICLSMGLRSGAGLAGARAGSEGVPHTLTRVCASPPRSAGRRFLFLQGGTQMIICEIVVGILIAKNFSTVRRGPTRVDALRGGAGRREGGG